jgi:1-acyl-sn-glycerol-3-phosphate acyltransferase
MAKTKHTLAGQTPPTGWRGWVYRSAVNFSAALARCTLFWQPEGTGNIPREGPVLVVANHPSYLDPPTLVCLMIYFGRRDVSIMAWDKLFDLPFVGFFTRTYKAYPVDRENPGRGPYQTLLRILQNGGAAGVFPEGSRSKGTLMGDWKPGALRAAFSTKATILPVTMVTVGEFWPRHRWRPTFFRRHRFVIHEPVPYSEYAAEMPEGARARDFQEQVAARIREIINGPLLKRQQDFEAHELKVLKAGDPTRAPEGPAEAYTRRQAQAREVLAPTTASREGSPQIATDRSVASG